MRYTEGTKRRQDSQILLMGLNIWVMNCLTDSVYRELFLYIGWLRGLTCIFAYPVFVSYVFDVSGHTGGLDVMIHQRYWKMACCCSIVQAYHCLLVFHQRTFTARHKRKSHIYLQYYL